MSAGLRGRLAELVVVATCGALLSVPLVQTALWPLALACIVALYVTLQNASVRRSALLGGVFGSAWLGTSVWWLYISMHSYGGLFAGLAVLAVILLSVALSLLLSAAMAVFARLRRGGAGRDALLFAGCWLLAEIARGVVFTGFPWGACGYTQIDGPLAALAPWIGVYGIGAVAAWVAAVLAGAWRDRASWLAAAAVLLVIALWAAPSPEFTASAGRLQVALLQTNVAQDEKFAEEQLPGELAWVAARLFESKAQLIVTPETAVPLLPGQLEQFDPGYWASLVAHFKGHGGSALVGAPLGDFETGYTNSVVGLSAAGDRYRYDKHHLVPFGEFIPLGFHWFVDLMNIPLGDFARGPLVTPPFAVKGQRVTPNICYEDLFGEELAALFADAGGAPTVLSNVSNIAWFGDTVAIGQHLNISRMRTLELQRPMLRATNTGATAIIDHRGRVLAQLLPFTQGVLEGEVEGRTGLTPFARWASRFGLWPLVAVALLLVAGAVLGKRP